MNLFVLRKRSLLVIAGIVFVSARLMAQTEPNVKPPDARGVYAIWYGADTGILSTPYIKGGQVVLQWADVEPAEGKYDFSVLDEQLRQMKEKGKWTTVQVNGNQKPKWLYKKVPVNPEKLSHQIGDNEGTLMYWHPAFIKAYSDFLKAYANHLKSSKYLSILVGVRMNFNALGTEHFPVPQENRSLDQWKLPAGVQQGVEWTEAISDNYQRTITDEYIKDFAGMNVFMRNNIPKEAVDKYQKEFETGRLSLFHTSSEMEPRNSKAEENFKLFYKYCRSGKTLAYAEPWASAWGEHGGLVDPRWASPSQWTYWRVLNDLNFGVSVIAIYTNDLVVAQTGFKRKGIDARQYQAEFQKAYTMAAKYAGYHASPQVAPGAWVAFRHADVNLMTKKDIKEFTGNYTFLMQQVLPDETKNMINIGDSISRFGAWGKLLPQGKTIGLQLSELFAQSIKGNPSVLKIIYYDGNSGSFETLFGDQKINTTLSGSGKWKTLEIPVAKSDFTRNKNGAHITVKSTTGDIIFHMVNVERGNGIPSDVKNVMAKYNGNKLTLKWVNSLDYDIDKIVIYKNGEALQATPSYNNEVTLNGVSKSEINQLVIKTINEAGRSSAGTAVKL